jgi:hypothetical protein
MQARQGAEACDSKTLSLVALHRCSDDRQIPLEPYDGCLELSFCEPAKLVVEPIGKVDLRLERRYLIIGLVGNDDVAENEHPARAKRGGYAGKQESLFARWEMMQGERRDDEIEVIVRQRVLEPTYSCLDPIVRKESANRIDHGDVGIDSDEVGVRMKGEHPACRLARPDAQIEHEASVDSTCRVGDRVLEGVERRHRSADASPVVRRITGDLTGAFSPSSRVTTALRSFLDERMPLSSAVRMGVSSTPPAPKPQLSRRTL